MEVQGSTEDNQKSIFQKNPIFNKKKTKYYFLDSLLSSGLLRARIGSLYTLILSIIMIVAKMHDTSQVFIHLQYRTPRPNAFLLSSRFGCLILGLPSPPNFPNKCMKCLLNVIPCERAALKVDRLHPLG